MDQKEKTGAPPPAKARGFRTEDQVENGNKFLGSKCSTTGCGFKQHVYVLGPVKNKKPVRKCYSCFT